MGRASSVFFCSRDGLRCMVGIGHYDPCPPPTDAMTGFGRRCSATFVIGAHWLGPGVKPVALREEPTPHTKRQ